MSCQFNKRSIGFLLRNWGTVGEGPFSTKIYCHISSMPSLVSCLFLKVCCCEVSPQVSGWHVLGCLYVSVSFTFFWQHTSIGQTVNYDIPLWDWCYLVVTPFCSIGGFILLGEWEIASFRIPCGRQSSGSELTSPAEVKQLLLTSLLYVPGLEGKDLP